MNRKRGFTLLELLIVIAILALILGVQNTFYADALLAPETFEEHNKKIPFEGGVSILQEEIDAYRELWNTKLGREMGYLMTNEEAVLNNLIHKKFYTVTQEQLEAHKRLSKELCLNILIETFPYIYNGEYVGVEAAEPYLYSAKIAGDRLGYLDSRFADGWHVIVDRKDYGAASSLLFSEKHVAFSREVGKVAGTDLPVYHMIFDGKDLGQGTPLKIVGDSLLYNRDGKLYSFKDGEIVAREEDVYTYDTDGKDEGFYEFYERGNMYRIYYNGALFDTVPWTHNIDGPYVEGGHIVYAHGPAPGSNFHHVYYDGKDLGFGVDPVLEGDHLAYRMHRPDEHRFIYDGKDYGQLDGWSIYKGAYDLSGDHFAFMQTISPEVTRLNIDGTAHAIGNFKREGIQITKKSNCTPQGGLLRVKGGTDVWIVKYVGDKKFKRLILSPHVFNSYGHLKWENVIEVEPSVLDEYTTSDLIRAEGDAKVYRLFPQGDTGTKRWISTMEAFTSMGFDWDAIYEINQVDRDSYIDGPQII